MTHQRHEEAKRERRRAEREKVQAKKPCTACAPQPDEVNHPRGMIFVGWGRGWETCSQCNGTEVQP